LRDIVAVANRSGAHVLISTVATNLKDCAPFASLHREGIRPDELSSWEGLVQRGAALENAGSHSEALKRKVELMRKDAVSIVNDELVRMRVGKDLPKLLNSPFC